jgi:hypothetical protein
MRVKLCSLLLAIVTALTLAPAAGAQVQCPNCHKDQVPMAGHGAAPDGSGRRNVNVQIEFNGSGSWTNPATGNTNDNIWNGVRDSNTVWNNARDGSGNATGYYFNLNQGAARGDVDVLIVLGNPGTGNAAQTRGTRDSAGNIGPPYTIVLPASASSWNPNYMRSVIEHELGHTIGLSHAYINFNTCGHTIMNHGTASGRVTGAPQAQDVTASNRHLNDRTVCQHTFGQNAATIGGGGGGGYTEPNPWRYSPTCYYFWDAVDYYYCYDGCRYAFTVYYLTDSFCF